MADELLRLNLGSGPKATPGWVCIDRSPNTWLSRARGVKRVMRDAGILSEAHMASWDRDILRGDIRRLKYGDGTVDAVYSSHALEHIYLDEARAVLRESRRVLRPDGVIRLALPDATVNARQLVEGEARGDASAGALFNDQLLAHPQAKAKGVRALVGRAGGHVHLWQPTPTMVGKMLEDAGFVDVNVCSYHQGDLPSVQDIETRPEGLHIEAKAPPAASGPSSKSSSGWPLRGFPRRSWSR